MTGEQHISSDDASDRSALLEALGLPAETTDAEIDDLLNDAVAQQPVKPNRAARRAATRRSHRGSKSDVRYHTGKRRRKPARRGRPELPRDQIIATYALQRWLASDEGQAALEAAKQSDTASQEATTEETTS